MSRILVIDDDDAFCNLIEALLQSAGHEIHKAHDAPAALEKLALMPDLIFLDIMMADMNGLEVLTRLKQKPETRGIPVIMCSVMADRPNRDKARVLGAVDFIPKPFEPAEFVARTQTALSHAP